MGKQSDVVLVTGSSGLIGAAAIRFLAPTYQMVGFDRDNPPHPPSEAECVCMDLTSNQDFDAAFQRIRYAYGDRIAAVIHLAAYYDFSGEASPKYDEVTVRGTQRLLRALRDFEVDQFIFSSTMLVHAPAEPGKPISEDSPIKATWAYPQSKIETEELIRRERGSIPTVILRIAGVYDDVCHSIPLADQLRRIYERRATSHFYPGDPNRGQSFVHLDDVARALQLSVDNRTRLPQEAVFLVGEPETLSYQEIQRMVGRMLHGEEWNTKQIPKPLARLGAHLLSIGPWRDPFIRPWMVDRADDHYELEVSRAREVLGWSPTRSLRETLPKMVDSLVHDPASWYAANELKPPRSLVRGKRESPKPALEVARRDG